MSSFSLISQIASACQRLTHPLRSDYQAKPCFSSQTQENNKLSGTLEKNVSACIYSTIWFSCSPNMNILSIYICWNFITANVWWQLAMILISLVSSFPILGYWASLGITSTSWSNQQAGFAQHENLSVVSTCCKDPRKTLLQLKVQKRRTEDKKISMVYHHISVLGISLFMFPEWLFSVYQIASETRLNSIGKFSCSLPMNNT